MRKPAEIIRDEDGNAIGSDVVGGGVRAGEPKAIPKKKKVQSLEDLRKRLKELTDKED